MSELPRVDPARPGASVPPVRPSRRTGREPRKQSGEKKRRRERSEAPVVESTDEDAPTEPKPGGGIDLRV